MSYSISSNKFTHPLLKPILLELTKYFKETGISFFVIGATARDITMELHDVTHWWVNLQSLYRHYGEKHPAPTIIFSPRIIAKGLNMPRSTHHYLGMN